MGDIKQQEKVADRVGMPLAEFLREQARAPFELIAGEKKPIMPTVFGHTEFIMLLYELLRAVIFPAKLGLLLIEGTFILPDRDDADWVRGSRTPDLMFYAGGRLEAYKAAHVDYRERPLALAPDLVIEVVSPNDSYSDVGAKVAAYLADGVPHVWVFDPQVQTVAVHVAGGAVRLLTAADTLEGGDVLPGWRAPLAEVFA